VNVASRIEKLAEPGGICISDRVYYDIRNKPNIQAEYLGEKALKNVSQPMKLYCLRTASDYMTAPNTEKAADNIQKPSIAVLPFVDMSPNKDQEWFCDGISEEIINALTHIEDLRVIARTSAFAFKGKNEDIREIGKKLDVKNLLEGSIRKAGNRFRITAQLIKVEDGSHLWSERFDRDLEDVFAIQDEISMAIVEALKVRLWKTEKAGLLKRYTEDMEAYNLYLKGNYYWQMLTIEKFFKAIKYFEQALQKDPNYALAYYGMAMVYCASAYWGNVPPNEVYPKAKEYAKKALEIDSNLAEAHTPLGIINMNYDWNWKAAEREFKQALQLYPNSAFIHLNYSLILTLTDHHVDAISEAKLSRELDPLSSIINAHVSLAFIYAGQNDRAIEELKMAISINPHYFLAHHYLGCCYLEKSMFEAAIVEFEKAVELSGGAPIIVTFLAVSYYEFGNKDKVDKLFDTLKKRTRHEYVPPLCFYYIHKVRGENDHAFEWLERACNEHDSFLPWLKIAPIEKHRIPDEPRFKVLLKKAGLPE